MRWSTTGDLFAVQAQMTLDIYNTVRVLLPPSFHLFSYKTNDHAQSMSPILTINLNSRLHDALFAPHPHPTDSSDELLLVAAENKKVHVFEVPKNPSEDGEGVEWKKVAELVGHGNRYVFPSFCAGIVHGELTMTLRRVKALDKLTLSTGADTTTIISTVSSDGFIRIFDLAALPSSTKISGAQEGPAQVEEAASYDTKGTRLTCVTLADGEALDQPSAGNAGEKRKRDIQEDGEDSEEGSEEEGPGWASEVEGEEEGEEEEEEE